LESDTAAREAAKNAKTGTGICNSPPHLAVLELLSYGQSFFGASFPQLPSRPPGAPSFNQPY